ncbi:MAG: type II secretion system protein GspM [bacterium]
MKKKISQREKRLVSIALAAIAAFLVFQFAIDPFLQYVDRIQEEIPKMKGDLLTARRMRNRYRALDKEINDIRQRLEQRTAEFNPHDFLSTLAQKLEILPNLEDIKLDAAQINESYEEDTATVGLKNVQLEKLVSYLFEVENSGQLLTVKELSIEPDKDNSLLLDVEFDVSTFTKSKQPVEDTKGKSSKKPRRRKT